MKYLCWVASSASMPHEPGTRIQSPRTDKKLAVVGTDRRQPSRLGGALACLCHRQEYAVAKLDRSIIRFDAWRVTAFEARRLHKAAILPWNCRITYNFAA